jgi:outer membrane protein assembly factor BamD (BamD/ComL family)
MGHKPTRKRQRFHLYIAGCLIGGLLFMSCATGAKRPPANYDPAVIAERHLAIGECRLQQGNFEAARRECDIILTQYPGRSDDQALYLMGMVLVHPENPGQDIQQAAARFQGIVDRFPDSDLVAASQTWLALIAQLEKNHDTVERLGIASTALEKQLKDEKSKRIRLEKRLQQMKTIDLTVE